MLRRYYDEQMEVMNMKLDSLNQLGGQRDV